MEHRPIGFDVEMNGYNDGGSGGQPHYPPLPQYQNNEPPPVGFEGMSPPPTSYYHPHDPAAAAAAGNGMQPAAPEDRSSFTNPSYVPAKDEIELDSNEKDTAHSSAGGGGGNGDGADHINGKQEQGQQSDQTDQVYFRDGLRRIDYVLAYRIDDSERGQKRTAKRKRYEAALTYEGLELEEEDESESQDGKTFFVKVHATWEVLTRYAEMMNIKMPISNNEEAEKEKRSCWAKMPNPFAVDADLLPEEPDYYTAAFNRDRIDQFIIPEDKDKFFSNAQRSRIVYEILSRTKYEEHKNKFGIKKLLNNNAYIAAYPLHEGKYSTGHSILVDGADNDRQLLYETWARPGRWFYFQPLDLIRTYFGEKIAIYFTWLGFYTGMLIPASMVGVACFVYGIVTLGDNIPSEDVCNDDNTTMCPLCDTCPTWNLKESSCTYSRASYLFDNSATIFFSVFMSIWATLFLEFWKRKQHTLAWDWDVQDFENELQPVRPEYEARVKTHKVNPVNHSEEPYLPFWNKLARWLASGSVVLFMLLVVLGALLGVIIYRIVVVTLLNSSDNVDLIKGNAKIITTITAATINLIAIMLLSRVYYRIAVFLTDLECPRTQTEYDDSFTLKMFLFMFVNYYSSLIYIAFFKGSIASVPNSDDKYPFGKQVGEVEQCDPAGCLIEVSIQLIIIMLGKQSFSNINEIMIPKLLNWYRKHRGHSADADERTVYTRWEQDFDLSELPPKGLFDEYLEMVIQYGFVTLFVAAFPLAPLFALLNNIIEIRLDAYKFVTQLRRPYAMRAQDIGVWYGILNGVSKLAVLCNAFIIAYTSDFIPRLVYYYAYSEAKVGERTLKGYIQNSLSTYNGTCSFRGYYEQDKDTGEYEPSLMYWHIFAARLAFVVVFEHFVFFTTTVIAYLVPDIPQSVAIQEQREAHLAKEAKYSRELKKTKEKES